LTLLCIDESGNTQSQIALGLVAIPDKAIDPLCQIFTLRPTDPEPIKALFLRDPEAKKRKQGEPAKPREEFKYSDFLNAERASNLAVYRDFIKTKLELASKLPIQIFCSIFDKPELDIERLKRFNLEARTLIHLWYQQNMADSYSPELKIVVDREVFPEEMLFQVYQRRNVLHCEIFPTRMGSGTTHYGGRENQVIIEEKSSKLFKPLQFTDFVVGALREGKIYNRTDVTGILNPLLNKRGMRDIRGNYEPLPGLRIRVPRIYE
jgi:hypothetical protein